MKHKQAVLLAVLLVLVVALAGAYGALRLYNAGLEAQTEEEAVCVADVGEVTALSFTNQHGSFSFTRTEGTWSYDGDPDFSLDGSYLDTLAAALAPLNAVRAVYDPDALEAYGLAEPACTVTAQGDGTTVTILIGDAAGSDYYAKTADSDTVYTINGDLLSAMDYDLNALAALPDIPAAGEADLTTLQVERDGSTFTLTKQTETTETDNDSAENSTDGAAESAQPETQTSYHWYLDGVEVTDSEVLRDALAELATLSLSACYSYDPDADALAACGLDSPAVTVTVQTDSAGYTLAIGSAGESGYYVRIDGAGPIYLLSSAQAEALTALQVSALTAAE